MPSKCLAAKPINLRGLQIEEVHASFSRWHYILTPSKCTEYLFVSIQQSAERCVSTLLDLIQTKVNYVVQEAIVVIKDIFRKYPNKYESIISTLCENLDTLDEPEAR